MLFPFIYKAKRDKVKLFVGFYGISLAESDHHYGKKAQVQKSVAGHHEDLTKYLRRNGYFGAVDIFRGSDMSLLFWSQIRNWLGMSLHKVNSFLTKTRKTSLYQRQGLRPFAIFGLRAYERHASHRPPTANGRFSYVESWRCHKGKP